MHEWNQIHNDDSAISAHSPPSKTVPRKPIDQEYLPLPKGVTLLCLQYHMQNCRKTKQEETGSTYVDTAYPHGT